MDQIGIKIERTQVNEGDSFGANVYFFDSVGEALEAPSSVDFRVDCLTTKQVVKDWTSAVVGPSSSISIESAYNEIKARANKRERKQLTVRANRGATSQVSGQVRWTVRNQGFTE